MSFPLDPANLGFTKVNDLAYDSKLVAGLHNLGKFSGDFAAIRGYVDFTSEATGTDKVLPVMDYRTGEPIPYRQGVQILSARASRSAAFSTKANVSAVQLCLASEADGVYTGFYDLTAAQSGTQFDTADLVMDTQLGLPLTGGYVALKATIAVVQTTGQVDVAVLTL